MQKGPACHAHSLSRFSFLSTTTIIEFSVHVKCFLLTLDKVILQEYLRKFDLSKFCTRKHLTIEITIAINCLSGGASCKKTLTSNLTLKRCILMADVRSIYV